MPTARVHLEGSMALCRESGDSLGLAAALVTLGEVAVMQEDTAVATDLLMQSLALYEKEDHSGGTAWTVNHLGHVAQLLGEYARAIELHERSLSLMQRHGQLEVAAYAFESLGQIALSQDDASRAWEHYSESLALFRQHGDKQGIAWCLAGIAGTAALSEEPQCAARLWGAGEALRERLGCRIAPASRRNRERTVAMLHTELGEAEFARLTAEGAKMTVDEAVAFALTDEG